MSALNIITYLGIFIFAITGALKARAYNMDIFGGLVVAFATAYGGGTLRDLLIGIRPVNWVNNNGALLLVFAGTAITFLLKTNVNKFHRTIFFTDAIGLGLFTAAGIEVSLRNQLNDPYALVMGVITATFGGLIADIFCNAVPNLFKRGELYATVCAAGGVVYLLLKGFNLPSDINLATCVVFVVALRIYSKRKRIMLPDI
ncbi:trimeric intracellular cation channel family protein [Ferruginibacter sp. HRS2-29]|uniref:trimeric intracellular cation channel family protein n=1 Tax=Ferruginibacter sp. HRS2-29 TaxID=2487334 RepID=UPI0020CFA716|nr:trimeric intracellular cation channel family protein [Ferruginibacter sp. HRS2-29]MCP9751670.1 trimeric intracellular cation channel family protein [Ferruginibacter sp. HRS2-29]